MSAWLSALIIALLAPFLLAGCDPQQRQAVLQTADDVRLLEKCPELQAAKDRLHLRLPELSTPDLLRLQGINKEGVILCTGDLDALIAELEAMAETLP